VRVELYLGTGKDESLKFCCFCPDVRGVDVRGVDVRGVDGRVGFFLVFYNLSYFTPNNSKYCIKFIFIFLFNLFKV
jgi:hypothetical protein